MIQETKIKKLRYLLTVDKSKNKCSYFGNKMQ